MKFQKQIHYYSSFSVLYMLYYTSKTTCNAVNNLTKIQMDSKNKTPGPLYHLTPNSQVQILVLPLTYLEVPELL